MEENQGTVAHSNIVINGQEYSPEDAQTLIDLGNKTREYEQKWNTPLDKVWPAYGESTTKLKQVESELEQARNQLTEIQSKQEKGIETPTDIKQAQEAARKLGIILNEDLEQSGYIKKDDLPKYFQEYQSKQDAVNKILSEAEGLEKEINGSDGRPKFNKKAVLAYAQAYNKDSLMDAYEEMHDESVKAWKQAQIDQKRTPGLKTFNPGGKKEPSDVKVNDDNVKDLLREKLYGSQE